MTNIEIPLNKGYNYISFPAISADDFGTIFTNSGISGIIEYFRKYDPASSQWIDVNDIEFIEEARGYLLSVTSTGTITYEGIEYSITFDQFKLHVLNGWNFLGTGSNILIPKNWCKIIDPKTSLPVAQIEPTHAYWVDSDECKEPIFNTQLFLSLLSLGVITTSLFMAYRHYKKF